MTEVGELFERASARFEETAARVGAGAWQQATTCAVSVEELIRHVVAGNWFAVRLLCGETADEAVAALDRITDAHGDLLQQVVDSCLAQTLAFKRADTTRLLHHPSGDIDYDTFVRFRLGELVIHGWDIAVAAGIDAAFEDVVVRELWLRVAPHVEHMRSMGTYGASSTGALPPDAADEERLLDAFGRRM